MDQVIEEQKPEKRDVSRQTLVILVILAVVVSLLGTFTVLRETSGANVRTTQIGATQVSSAGSQTTQGKITLTVVSPGTAVASKESSAQGYVALNIHPRS